MIELDYFFTESDEKSSHYQLIQFSQNEPWRLVQDGELLGSLEKWNGKWQQLSGSPLSDALLEGICKLIESQHYHELPVQLLSRWGNVIAEVITKSDDEYLIICKERVSFRSFTSIFSKFVSTMLKDEWPVRFQLFNADFSEDFEIMAQPVKASYNFGWKD
ncbi:hypothetical protein [Pedobacter soli]|uniref:Uncharacterized protein n=1 Tax=Pedobacter soli TaxID=390242 RepID=A0A1G6SBW6_9SPHI|nr:hypothetical protein [Pedobacter soli]SDD14223.1 hypothetical protein SAMN04488024_104211 [Pedobacter soli]